MCFGYWKSGGGGAFKLAFRGRWGRGGIESFLRLRLRFGFVIRIEE